MMQQYSIWPAIWSALTRPRAWSPRGGVAKAARQAPDLFENIEVILEAPVLPC
jgi:hypothetical protein